MQRVAITLMMDPPLVLADEPTSKLDSRTGADIMNLLAAIAHDASGERAVVMVTHDQQAAERTDRIITLRDGRTHLPSAYRFLDDQTMDTGPQTEAF